MFKTTLCYIEDNGKYLMMLRGKKANDPSSGKWIGPGGKFMPEETAEECMLREVREETGLQLHQWFYHGVIDFNSDRWESEEMHLFSATLAGIPNLQRNENGEVIIGEEFNVEGDLKWIPKEDIMSLSLWEGDRIFLQKILDGEGRFNMRFYYEGDVLAKVEKL